MTTAKLGVCYYPEHWPEEQWLDDAQRMASLGLTWVRIGEFAWSQIEPTPGKFYWDWLDRAILILGNAGLKVILGTPTATPPRWMLDRHPDMLAYNRDGRPRKFGSRRHYCFSHSGYLLDCIRITTALAERYSRNKYVQAWQTDNEYGCHDTTVSYSPAARSGFCAWLKKKYKKIEHLNDAWGNVFWSMEYRSFDEIDLPNLTVTEPNPAHEMDFRRYSSDQVVNFNFAQTKIIREYCYKPIIHNYMGRVLDFDHFDVGADLDIASWDSYPLGFLENVSDRDDPFKTTYARQGDPDFQAFHHDLYRAVGKGHWWVMEQQPGQVNWARYNPAPLPDMVRLWAWEAIAHGAEAVNFFRWQQARFGQEQMHAGLNRPDGQPASVMPEIEQLSQEIKMIGPMTVNDAPVAIVFDYPSSWAWTTQPQGEGFDYFKLIFDFYCGLRKLGLSIDILPSTTTDFGSRKLVLIPALFCWNDKLASAIQKFDGTILLGPRSGSKTKNFQIPEGLAPDLDDWDLKVTAVESLAPGSEVELTKGGNFKIWCEFIESGETIVETTTDTCPAMVEKDNIRYLGGWPDDIAMDRILKEMTEIAGITTEKLPNGLRRRDHGDYRLYVNYSDETVSHLGQTLAPAAIMWINRENGSILLAP